MAPRVHFSGDLTILLSASRDCMSLTGAIYRLEMLTIFGSPWFYIIGFFTVYI